MNVPEPVMSLAVTPVSKDSGGQVVSLYICNQLICSFLHTSVALVLLYSKLNIFAWAVFKSFESFPERGSYFSGWIGCRERSSNIFFIVTFYQVLLFIHFHSSS
jgi:hypothetical protein